MFTFMILFPLIVAIIGLAIWVFAANPKLNELGRYMLIIGMFCFVFYASTKVVSCGTITTETRR